MEDLPSGVNSPTDDELPQCKIKRNYSCSHCLYFTQNPRFYLSHLRDTHGERITINNCSLCLYASRHYQKLVRHMKMVHGSTAEGIPGQSRKRLLIDDVPPLDSFAIPPLPTSSSKWIMDIDNLSYDLKSSRNTLRNIAAIYYAENDVEDFLAKMEASDVVEVMPFIDASPSNKVFTGAVFGDPKCLGDEELHISCPCGCEFKSFGDLMLHGKSCSVSNDNIENQPLDLSIKQLDTSESAGSQTNDIKVVNSKNQGQEFSMNYEILGSNSIKNDSKGISTVREGKVPFEEVEVSKILNHEVNHEDNTIRKVFKCPLCPFWASTASRFHIHIVGHRNKKPFKCSLCAYSSNWRWDITKHMRLKTLRSPSHKNARILIQGESGHRNYAKYNKYIKFLRFPQSDCDLKSKICGEIVSDENSDPKAISNELDDGHFKEVVSGSCDDTKNRSNVNQTDDNNSRSELRQIHPRTYVLLEHGQKTNYKCSKCGFRHPNRDAVLAHVKVQHQESLDTTNRLNERSIDSVPKQLDSSSSKLRCSTIKKAITVGDSLDSKSSNIDLAVGNRSFSSYKNDNAPFRCWHCHQGSNWKHVIQRHCRLKHSGLIRIEAFDQTVGNGKEPSYRILNLSENSQPILDIASRSDKTKNSESLGGNTTDQVDSIQLNEKLPKKISNVAHRVRPKNSQLSVMKFLKFKCNDCPYVCANKLQLKKHYTRRHNLSNIDEKINNLSGCNSALKIAKGSNTSKSEEAKIGGKKTLVKNATSNLKTNNLQIQFKIEDIKSNSEDSNEKNIEQKPLNHRSIFVNPKTGQIVTRR